MTLNDIIVSALEQLDRGHDASLLDKWRNKFTQFANEALYDIAYSLKMFKTEKVTAQENYIDLKNLSRECIQVKNVSLSGTPVPFHEGTSSDEIYVGASGEYEITYTFLPSKLSMPSDIPEIPENLHSLIVCYVVGRELMSGEASVHQRSNSYISVYEQGKKRIESSSFQSSSHKILNRYD